MRLLNFFKRTHVFRIIVRFEIPKCKITNTCIKTYVNKNIVFDDIPQVYNLTNQFKKTYRGLEMLHVHNCIYLYKNLFVDNHVSKSMCTNILTRYVQKSNGFV